LSRVSALPLLLLLLFPLPLLLLLPSSLLLVRFFLSALHLSPPLFFLLQLLSLLLPILALALVLVFPLPLPTIFLLLPTLFPNSSLQHCPPYKKAIKLT